MLLFTEHYLVIDYGSTNIKGALYQSGPGGTHILRLESLPVVSVVSNIQSQEKQVVVATKAENKSTVEQDESKQVPPVPLQEAELGEYEYNLIRYVLSFFPEVQNYLVNVPLERVYVRDLSLPIANLKQINEIIPFEVENLIPAPLDDVEVLGMPWHFEDDVAQVVSFSVERDTLSEIVDPLQNSESAIKMISVDAVGLFGFISLLPDEQYIDKIIAQIDIGGDFTIFNVLQNGKLVFTRKIIFGGSQITQLVSEVLRISVEEAEQRKIDLQLDLALFDDKREKEDAFYKNLRIEPSKYKSILKKLDGMFRDFVSEIERSVLSLPCDAPVLFFLSGGASLQPGVQDYLTRRLDKPVREYPVALTNGEPAALWATTIGTGALYRNKPTEKLDYLKTIFGQTLRGGEFNFSMFSTPVMIILLSAVLFLVSLVGSVFLDKKQIKSNLAQLIKVSKKIPGVENRSRRNYKSLLKNIKQVCRTRLRSAGSGGEGDSVLNILKEITQNTPGKENLDLRIRQFSYDGKSVKFDAEVKKYEDTSKLIGELKKSNLFFDIKLANNRRAYNQKVIRITVQMKINKKSAVASASCR